jgi:hypothetical protein
VQVGYPTVKNSDGSISVDGLNISKKQLEAQTSEKNRKAWEQAADRLRAEDKPIAREVPGGNPAIQLDEILGAAKLGYGAARLGYRAARASVPLIEQAAAGAIPEAWAAFRAPAARAAVFRDYGEQIGTKDAKEAAGRLAKEAESAYGSRAERIKRAWERFKESTPESRKTFKEFKNAFSPERIAERETERKNAWEALKKANETAETELQKTPSVGQFNNSTPTDGTR